ncbi:MAG: 50S ribosomal protein L35, partial [Actinomycetales bacterium]|nr:50S ribosomal protein L35 [Candidatus Phosphoribacter hodrii]
MKTHSGAKKRFPCTGTGKIMRAGRRPSPPRGEVEHGDAPGSLVTFELSA